MTLPRIGYHIPGTAQDEGWVRMARHLKCPRLALATTGETGRRARKHLSSIQAHNLQTIGGVLPGRHRLGLPSGAEHWHRADQTDDVRSGLRRDRLRELTKFASDGSLLMQKATSSVREKRTRFRTHNRSPNRPARWPALKAVSVTGRRARALGCARRPLA